MAHTTMKSTFKKTVAAAAMSGLMLGAAAYVTGCADNDHGTKVGDHVGANHACKGQNTCKGHGWVATESDKACADQGGTIIAHVSGTAS